MNRSITDGQVGHESYIASRSTKTNVPWRG